MKPIMKTNALIVFCLTMLSFSGCQTGGEGKDRLEPPEMMKEGKHDYVSYSTEVVGEFQYYGETLMGDFVPGGFAGYKFIGKRDEVVSIELTAQTSDMDTVLYLYPPVDPSDSTWKSPIAENDDIDWPENSNSAIVDFTLPEDGIYLIVVAEYHRKSGAFFVTLNCTGGGCVVELKSRCERLGGTCTSLMGECPDSYEMVVSETGQALGCGGSPTMCCVPADSNPYACGSPGDCVMAKADCCGCQMGGTSVAINKNFADMSVPDPRFCGLVACMAVYMCFGGASCIDGMCTTVSPDEAACIDSGGSIETISCCEGTGDFPNTCLIGPCGCAPEDSHDVRSCDCPEGQCFDGDKCVSVEPDSRCERLGGHCTSMVVGECTNGSVMAHESGQALGCGGPLTMCCVPADSNPYVCGSDGDCVMAKADCCGCMNGGTSVAINKNFADMAGPDPYFCQFIHCLAYVNCFGVARCIYGMCTTVSYDEANCIDSGGSVETISCCEGVGDFPDRCQIGSCSCVPEESHDVRACDCPEGQCFDGYKCVNRE